MQSVLCYLGGGFFWFIVFCNMLLTVTLFELGSVINLVYTLYVHISKIHACYGEKKKISRLRNPQRFESINIFYFIKEIYLYMEKFHII